MELKIKNKKFSFGERRFVFEKKGAEGQTSQPAKAPVVDPLVPTPVVEAPPTLADALKDNDEAVAGLARDTERAQATHGAGVERTQSKTGIELATLGVAVQNQLKVKVNLKGIEEITQTIDANLDFSSHKAAIAALIVPRVDAGAVASAKTILENTNLSKEKLTDVAVRDLLVDLMATSAVVGVEAMFKGNGKYARMKDFLAAKKPPYANLGYKLSFGDFNKANVVLISDPATLDADYDKWVKDPKNAPKKNEEGDKKVGDSKKAAEALKKLPVLKFLGGLPFMSFFLPVDEKGNLTAEAYESIANGEPSWLAGIIQKLGGGGFILDGKDHWGEFSKALDPRHQATVEGLLGKVPKFLRLDGASEKFSEAIGAIASFDMFSSTQFGKLFSGGKMPDGGFSLSETFSSFLGGKGAEISLKNGAEMILPKGAKMKVLEGGAEVLKEAKTGPLKIGTGVLQILDVIPSGTKFTGAIDFGWFKKPSA